MVSPSDSEPPSQEDAAEAEARRARRREETEAFAATARRQLYILVATGFFLVLTLAVPDAQLVRADASIRWPLIQTEVPLATFLTYGPIALVALLVYLHLFVGRLVALRREGFTPKEVDLLDMSSPTARAVATFLLYGFVPLILAWFSWKVVFRDEARFLIAATLVVGFACGLLYHRRTALMGRVRLWGGRAALALGGAAAAAGLALTLPWADLGVTAGRGPSLSGERSHAAWMDPILLLRQLDLKRADLGVAGALHSVNLADQNLAHADARFARLIGADLRDTRLTRADLRWARIGGDAAGEGVRVTDFERARLEGARLDAADLRNVHFDHASLAQAHLDQAVLGDTRFWCADLAGAQMNRLEGTEGDIVFNGAQLDAAVLGEARLTAPNFTFASLVQADLEGARMPNAVFARADLSGARLGSARLRKARFLMATLQGADLSQADLTLADFTDADLTGARLVGADLTRARLFGALLAAADLEGAILTGANLRSARLLSARLDHADLSGAILADADLTGASLVGAFGLESGALDAARLCETLDPGGRLRNDDCETRDLRQADFDLQQEGLFDSIPGSWLAERAGLCARTVAPGPRSFVGRVRQMFAASGE